MQGMGYPLGIYRDLFFNGYDPFYDDYDYNSFIRRQFTDDMSETSEINHDEPINNNPMLNRKKGIKKWHKRLFKRKPFKGGETKRKYLAEYQRNGLQKLSQTYKNVSVEKMFDAEESETNVSIKLRDLSHNNKQDEIYDAIDFLFSNQNYKQFRSKAIPIFLELAEWADKTQVPYDLEEDLKVVLNFYSQKIITGDISYKIAMYRICNMVKRNKIKEENECLCQNQITQDQISFKSIWERLKKGYESKDGGFKNISNLKIDSLFEAIFKNENVVNRKTFTLRKLIPHNSKYKKPKPIFKALLVNKLVNLTYHNSSNPIVPKLESNNNKIIGLEEHK